MLRHQIAVMQRRQPRRPHLNWADRALIAALPSLIPKARRRGLRPLVTPGTILRWHRGIVGCRQAARSRRSRPGRPATRRNVRALVFRLARENPGWGYRRICGELAGLCVQAAAPAVWEILKNAGSIPRRGAPGLPGRSSCVLRPRRSWRGFLHGRPARRNLCLCPCRDRARDPACPYPRRRVPSHRGMDRSAGPQPDDGSWRAGGPGQVHDRDRDSKFTCVFGAVIAHAG